MAACAVANSGADLDAVKAAAEKANDNTYSMGVALSSSTLPVTGQPIFDIGCHFEGWFEIKGIHHLARGQGTFAAHVIVRNQTDKFWIRRATTRTRRVCRDQFTLFTLCAAKTIG